jgi:signal peptidase II
MVVNLAVLVAVMIYYPRIPAGEKLLRVSAGLIVAGDLGNVIDRLRTGYQAFQATGELWTALSRAYVIDFFDFKIWPVWNIADMCIVSGVLILAWKLWRAEKEISTQKPAPGEPIP